MSSFSMPQSIYIPRPCQKEDHCKCLWFKLEQDRFKADMLKDFLSIDFVCGYKMSSES